MSKTKEQAWDHHTRAGRKEIDAAVRRALGKRSKSRNAIAHTTGIAMAVVSASLRRGLREGWAESEGVRSATRYSKAVTK